MMVFSRQDEQQLLQIARESINYGFQHGAPVTIKEQRYSLVLRELAATFVTLKLVGVLRGCVGSIQAIHPLVRAIAQSAYNAAFSDPRFEPVGAAELPHLEVQISILGSKERLYFESEEDVLKQLQPGMDGVLIEYKHQRATFLPSVWESITDRGEFLATLKTKAGLPSDFWSSELAISRYPVYVIT